MNRVSERELENKYGLMVQSMKDFGSMIKLMEREDLYIQMEIYMKVIGSMIKQMDLGFTLTWMGPYILVSGRKTNSMVRARRHGQTKQSMREII